MKILMVVNWYTTKGKDCPDAGKFHLEQSLDLIKNGCEVAIFYPFDRELKGESSAEEEWGVLTYRNRYSDSFLPVFDKSIKQAFDRIVREFQPDVIHAHCGIHAGSVCVYPSKKYGIPLMITEHLPMEMARVDKLNKSHFIAKYAYGNSKANVCVSDDLSSRLSQVFKKVSFEVIYNGIICPEVTENQDKYRVPDRVNAVVVAVLYDKDIKGLQYLLPAVRELKDQGKDLVLHHVGGGTYLEHFKALAKELDIEDNVVFHGLCDRETVYEIVNDMDFFVSASLFESAGVAAEEAMLLGKPVLGTNSGGVNSLVPEKAGMIVEKGSTEALQEGLKTMMESLDSFDRNWIKDYAKENFEIGNISKKYIKRYKELLK
ncbi:MAG: glycosyltransferase family 4 protein [Bacteroidaceae bacterium]|nr:glycosyltransferase family 4 protein [Bacteroidaceae bacterium]